MATEPTFVLVLGAWMLPPAFDLLRAELAARGFPTEAPAHPSIGAEPPNKTLDDDVASLRALLTRLIEDEGKEVVVVAHSYGGVVGSSAVKGLAKADREANGQTGGVIEMVYLAAFALEQGKSLLDMLGGQYLPWMRAEGDYVHVDSAPAVAFHDLLPEDQEKQLAGLAHTSGAVFSGAVSYEPWHRIPSAYIVCEEDQALPLAIQEMMAARIGGRWTYRLKSSHSPFLSMPDKLADVMVELAGKV
ncbi:Alpha/beta hydrolase fold-1 [Aspergillus ambiguus]|uniref:alpha/beta hydrolase n=1 Tax=Aspergillus ambiguus TaxID=176160 RepID=UPI003CCD3F26